ncbi:GNAT family N-acetyltransferase [Nocardia sp. NPDC050710]|uniref:GNAT family N-acetyltransferase n=1 Tax=Nocardia sp. NPDC050710 TaxID=3157220 RepID=UPI0033D36CD2
MKIAITGDVERFEAQTESFLRRDPLRHTVITTIIANRRSGLDNTTDPCHFVSVHGDDGSVHGVAVWVAGREIYLGRLPADSVDAVADAFAEAVPQTGGVEGATDTALSFAERWAAVRGVGFQLSYVTRLYRLDTVRLPDVPGSPRRATESDLARCMEWSQAMRVESGIAVGGWNAVAMRRRIAAGRWWLWERDGRPVSLAAHQIPAHGWARIGPVYTPPADRGNGYAAVLTAHVGHTLRTGNVDVCLFADRANTTANKIYRAIGFQHVRDFAHYDFG